MNQDTVLSCSGLLKTFGGITATDHVSLQLQRGARHALIGPNGAGKTTLINLLTGVLTERCEQLLAQFHLTEVMDLPTPQLAYGKRRLLEMAIALASEPRVLLLDEPVAGVPAGEREELLQTVANLPADVSVLLIEHDMDLVFSFAHRMTVLVNGAVLTEGTPEQIAADPRVREVYLGHGDTHD